MGFLSRAAIGTAMDDEQPFLVPGFFSLLADNGEMASFALDTSVPNTYDPDLYPNTPIRGVYLNAAHDLTFEGTHIALSDVTTAPAMTGDGRPLTALQVGLLANAGNLSLDLHFFDPTLVWSLSSDPLAYESSFQPFQSVLFPQTPPPRTHVNALLDLDCDRTRGSGTGLAAPSWNRRCGAFLSVSSSINAGESRESQVACGFPSGTRLSAAVSGDSARQLCSRRRGATRGLALPCFEAAGNSAVWGAPSSARNRSASDKPCDFQKAGSARPMRCAALAIWAAPAARAAETSPASIRRHNDSVLPSNLFGEILSCGLIGSSDAGCVD